MKAAMNTNQRVYSAKLLLFQNICTSLTLTDVASVVVSGNHTLSIHKLVNCEYSDYVPWWPSFKC